MKAFYTLLVIFTYSLAFSCEGLKPLSQGSNVEEVLTGLQLNSEENTSMLVLSTSNNDYVFDIQESTCNEMSWSKKDSENHSSVFSSMNDQCQFSFKYSINGNQENKAVCTCTVTPKENKKLNCQSS